jgi:hypothetical protein
MRDWAGQKKHGARKGVCESGTCARTPQRRLFSLTMKGAGPPSPQHSVIAHARWDNFPCPKTREGGGVAQALWRGLRAPAHRVVLARAAFPAAGGRVFDMKCV